MEYQIDGIQANLKQDIFGDNYKPAGFWIRGVALAFDSMLLTLVLGGLSMLSHESYPVAMAGGAALALFYFTFFHGMYGATPGKSLLGSKVVSDEGGDLGYGKAFFRALSANVDFPLTLGIGYLIAAFSKNKKTIHDYICATKVIYVPGKKKQLAVFMVLLVIGLCSGLYLLFNLFYFFNAIMKKLNTKFVTTSVVQSNILRGDLNVQVESHLQGNVAANNVVLISSAQPQAQGGITGNVAVNNAVMQNNAVANVIPKTVNPATLNPPPPAGGGATKQPALDHLKDKVIDYTITKIGWGIEKVLSSRGWDCSANNARFTPPVTEPQFRYTTYVNILPATMRYTEHDFRSFMSDRTRYGYDIIDPLFSLNDWGVFALHKLEKLPAYGTKYENGKLVKVAMVPTEEMGYYFQKNGWPKEKAIYISFRAVNHDIFNKYRKDFEAAVMSVKETLENDSGYAR